jgi:hypothetical protein
METRAEGTVCVARSRFVGDPPRPELRWPLLIVWLVVAFVVPLTALPAGGFART